MLYRPSYSLAMVTLEANETIQAESGAMVAMQSRSQDSFLAWLIPRIPRQTTYVSSRGSS